MIKNLRAMILNVKTYPVLQWAILANTIVYVIIVGCFIWQNITTRNLVEETIISNQRIMETISIVSDKTGQHFSIATNNIIKPLEDTQKYEYKKFLEKYLERQSYYLNFWLSMLAIVLGIFAVIVPICFVKFAEDKKKELDLLIRGCKKQKAKTEVNVKQMEDKLTKVEEMTKEVKANTMISWLPFDVMNGKLDDALATVNESINIVKTAENLSARSSIYFKKNDYKNAIKDLEDCMKIKRNARILGVLGVYYIYINDYENSKKYILESMSLNPQNINNYYNLAETYIMLGDYTKAIEVLKEFIVKERYPYIYDDDKLKWVQHIQTSPKNEETVQLIKMINEKLHIRLRSPNSISK